MTKRLIGKEPRRYWSPADDKQLRALYPHHPTVKVAKMLGRSLSATYGRAQTFGLNKSAIYLASPESGRLYGQNGKQTRFPPGHVPANKGLRRPGYAPGRMKESQFKPGSVSKRWDPELYAVGALRLNADGYVDMKVKQGPRAWRPFHLILWEDVRGPIPKGYALVFKDGDRLNVELDNLEVITRADLMRRNTVHNLPAPLKSAIQLLGQVKRRIREKQNRGSAQPPVRDS